MNNCCGQDFITKLITGVVDVDPATPQTNIELREDSSYELREDGSLEIRE